MRMERELRDRDGEKNGFANQKERQDSYIEELLDAIKERDRIIERAEADRDAFEEDVISAKKELDKVGLLYSESQRSRERQGLDKSFGREA